jgi:hypothetical protein
VRNQLPWHLVVWLAVALFWPWIRRELDHASPEGLTHQQCLDDCEATGRGLWVWTPTSCECTP